ncbi:hoka [Rhodnius prolixus]|uniref:Uncharacterized protein n=1 Tax=Rhodnius prolixus TaxID=13249 RepID=T1HX73_RHOPR
MSVLKTVYYFAFTFVVISSLFSDVDARRKILRGRKTITREYHKEPLLPAWAKVILIGVGLLLSGVVLYFILYKFLVTD